MEQVDFIVLGGGTAGLAAAKAIRQAGKTVTLIDPHPVGGLCSTRGCNPKKILVNATEALHDVHQAEPFGLKTDNPRLDLARTVAHKRQFTDPVPADTEASLKRAGIERITAQPRFLQSNRLRAGDRVFQFDGALIATGSSPRPLNFPGAQHVHTSDDALELEQPPRRMAIIGSGAVALEFGQAFARLGTDVHMLSRSGQVLRGFEPSLVAAVVRDNEQLGITLHRQAQVEYLEAAGNGLTLRLDDGEALAVDYVLNAAGRVPALDSLGLENAGVHRAKEGVVTDAHLRCPSNPRIFAAGDALGQPYLTPAAGYEGRLAAHNYLTEEHQAVDYASVPRAVFTLPTIATVGKTEDQARDDGLRIECVEEDMSNWLLYRLHGAGPAFAKVIYEQHSGRVVGAHMFAPLAADAIHIFTLAMRHGIPRRDLADMIYVYPTLSGAIQYLT